MQLNLGGHSRTWGCEMHVGRRENTWVAFEGNFVELGLLALNTRTHSFTGPILNLLNLDKFNYKYDGGELCFFMY